MIEKLVRVNEMVEPDGHFNKAPSGWEKISPEDFVRLSFLYHTTHMEFRQIREPGSYHYLNSRLFWFEDKTGVAMTYTYDGKYHIQHYRFGCKHEWLGISQQECRKRGIYHGGNCYTVSECKLCKYVNAIDSSG